MPLNQIQPFQPPNIMNKALQIMQLKKAMQPEDPTNQALRQLQLSSLQRQENQAIAAAQKAQAQEGQLTPEEWKDATGIAGKILKPGMTQDELVQAWDSFDRLANPKAQGLLRKFVPSVELVEPALRAIGVKEKEGKPLVVSPGQKVVDYDGKVLYAAPGKPEQLKKETIPSAMKDFELTYYGKLVQDQRGTKKYKNDRLKWITEKKEISPYTDAINRQVDLDTKKEAMALRKEFNSLPEVKLYSDIKMRHDVMKEALDASEKTKNFVAIDQAIISTFNKMTDPDSVVRESEYARTAKDLAIWNKLKGKVQKWMKGGAGLTQNDRRAMFRMGTRFMRVADKKYQQRKREYTGYFNAYKVDPHKFFTPLENATQDLSSVPTEKLLEMYNAAQ